MCFASKTQVVRFLGNSIKKSTANAVLFFMVETTGIEPVTPCMSSKYSNQLSYASTRLEYYTTNKNKNQPLF